MSITRDQIEKVALLARLELSPEEAEKLTSQIAAIVDYVDQLGELDTDQVEPLAHPLDTSNVLAADEVQPSLSREDALRNAPRHDGEYYLVPPVLGE
ncbi:MAG: Asp-tRNA(Asn)/Glu-tRNA(Gln) amidotransferase subunit GatC [Pirellulales bacterium]